MRFSHNCFDSLRIINLGRISYQEGLSKQSFFHKIVSRSKAEPVSSNYLLCLEHTPVYTVGIRSKLYSDAEEKRLRSLGADFHRTSRGGLITFHGPGQLVIYPIVDLRRFSTRKIGVRVFVETLEQSVIDCASNDFHIDQVGRSDSNTGVWVGNNKKLCALGISVQHGITGHGLAMNCNTELKWFDNIVACGIEGAEATSLSRECSTDISTMMAAPLLCKQFARNFQCDIHSWENCEDWDI